MGLVLANRINEMALNSIANVAGRYLFNQGLYFSEELNQFLMVAITFIGLSYVTRKGRHIRMSALYDALNARFKRYLMLLICLCTAAVMFMLAYYAYEYLAKLASRGKVTPSLRVPMYLTLIFLPVGFAITGLQYLMTFIRNLSSEQIHLAWRCVDSYDSHEPEPQTVVEQANDTPSLNRRAES